MWEQDIGGSKMLWVGASNRWEQAIGGSKLWDSLGSDSSMLGLLTTLAGGSEHAF